MTNTPITPEEAVKLLRETLQRLVPLNLGDHVYGVRDSVDLSKWEGSSWDHPKVIEFGAAIDGIENALAATAHLVEPAQTGGSDE